MTSNLGKRVLKHGFVITTTILTCTALRADHETSGDPTQKFLQKAAMGGRMEVKLGELARQNGQAQEVKSLGETLVRDHTQANQKLEQLAASKNITLGHSGYAADANSNVHNRAGDPSATASGSAISTSADQASNNARWDKGDKEHQAMDKLKSQSGSEFDKSFVRMAIKDHKKDIAEFEKARRDVTDADVDAFIDQTLPTLRNHLQMAQAAARTVGVDDASIAEDRQENSISTGAPAAGDVGTRGSDKPSSPASKPENKDRSSYDGGSRLNGRTDADASGTIQQNTPRADLNANAGDHSVSASTGVDSADSSAAVSAEASKSHKIFQKGDGKVLGLSTDKHDGKFLGIIPDPIKHKDKEASAGADIDVNGHAASVGGSATTQSGTATQPDEQK